MLCYRGFIRIVLSIVRLILRVDRWMEGWVGGFRGWVGLGCGIILLGRLSFGLYNIYTYSFGKKFDPHYIYY